MGLASFCILYLRNAVLNIKAAHLSVKFISEESLKWSLKMWSLGADTNPGFRVNPGWCNSPWRGYIRSTWLGVAQTRKETLLNLFCFWFFLLGPHRLTASASLIRPGSLLEAGKIDKPDEKDRERQQVKSASSLIAEFHRASDVQRTCLNLLPRHSQVDASAARIHNTS